MKKTMLSLVLLVAMLALAVPAMAATGSTGNNAEFVIGMSQYFVNDQTPGVSMDAAPYIDVASGRTLVPVRYLGDALGSTTNWDANTQTVTVTTAVYNISMNIGSATLTVNGQSSQMDVAPVIKDGRTYLPARWVANALGYQVDWNAANQMVIIWPNGTTEPDYSNVTAQAQQAQPVTTGGTTINGYVIPKSCQMTINGPGSPDAGPVTIIDMWIGYGGGDFNGNPITESVAQQEQDAQNILAQHFDQATVQAVISYVDQKTGFKYNLPDKEWHVNGNTIDVGGPYNDDTEISVMSGNV